MDRVTATETPTRTTTESPLRAGWRAALDKLTAELAERRINKLADIERERSMKLLVDRFTAAAIDAVGARRTA